MTPLWLAVHLPRLPLEARASLSPPSAIVEQGRILLGDDAARQAGIGHGTVVATARMLLPAIALVARDRAQEGAAMQALACWAGGFTPRISLTPGTLLLEIGSCLRLFGGLEQIVGAVSAGLLAQKFTAELAAAPAPLAAQWLAESGTAAFCKDASSMIRHLERLPLSVLPDRAAASLKRFGATTLGEVRRLPGAELARRIGLEPLQLIARAFGESADPRADFVFPERFAVPLQLPAAVDTAAALLFAAHRLTSALAGWLGARQAGVREFDLHLLHRRHATRLVLQFADLCADGQRFERILRDRLESITLDAPVESLRLEASTVASLPGRNQTLFADANADQEAVDALLERLSARLGETQVYRVSVHDDHRPECATRRAALFDAIAPGRRCTLPRPLWLVDPPQALAEVGGRPYRHGHLKLLAGPERIESGWWDAGERHGENGAAERGDLRRDYFIALAADACWLWIYRDGQAPGGWFVHGFFA